LHSDYQGSVVMVTDSAGRLEQHNTYYPYGEPHRLPSGQRRLYCGKERESVTGEYDYGARLHFAPGLLWTVPDALADKTPYVSPYVFCNANPVRNIDLEGKLTIFVNGMHVGDGGSSAYWNGVDKVVMNYTNDNHVKYIDGSMGGAKQTVGTFALLGGILSNTSAPARESAGFGNGALKAEEIYASLKEGESIRFVTHSMGAAYAKGFILGMESVLGGEIKNRIEYEVDIAPFQVLEQFAVPGVETGTLQHKDDKIAWHIDMPGARLRIKNDEHTGFFDLTTAHGIASFLDEIKLFLDALNEAIAEGKSKSK
ncbi:RHS repeat domain-containing protein, partial [uncultured Duncaniella sp.]|uniref:RHS repeat domain-containing protein n=1 Tax=uncultured Duncaniella sp. TaxID=2768039 RepID=UPI00262CDCC3